MTCCGHVLTRREWMWSAMLGSAGTVVGAGRARERRRRPRREAARGRHGGAARQRLGGRPHPRRARRHHVAHRARPSDEIARSMRAGRLAVLCLADVPDAPILGRNAQNVLAAMRVPEPGLLWKYHLDRLGWADELVAKHGIRRALTLADVKAAHAAGQPAIILDVEGLDFLEKKLERLEESYARGVRTMQLVHYTPNDLGDFQTGAVVHHGLTPVRRRRDPRMQQARRGGRRRARDLRHREAGGQGRHPAAAALAHRAARLEGARRHAAHRAPGHGRPRARHRGHGRLGRDLALLPERRALCRWAEGDGRRGGREPRQHRHRHLAGDGPLSALRSLPTARGRDAEGRLHPGGYREDHRRELPAHLRGVGQVSVRKSAAPRGVS